MSSCYRSPVWALMLPLSSLRLIFMPHESSALFAVVCSEPEETDKQSGGFYRASGTAHWNFAVCGTIHYRSVQLKELDMVQAPRRGVLQYFIVIAGTYLDEDDVLSADKVSKDGRTVSVSHGQLSSTEYSILMLACPASPWFLYMQYYVYEANSLSGNSGPHYVAVATAKVRLPSAEQPALPGALSLAGF